MLSSGSVLQDRDFPLHPHHLSLAQHNFHLISTPRQRQCSQITFLHTNIWTRRQNPQGALTPSRGGHRFHSATGSISSAWQGARSSRVSRTRRRIFYGGNWKSRYLLVPPLGRDSICHLGTGERLRNEVLSPPLEINGCHAKAAKEALQRPENNNKVIL